MLQLCHQLKFEDEPNYNQFEKLISEIGVFETEEESKVILDSRGSEQSPNKENLLQRIRSLEQANENIKREKDELAQENEQLKKNHLKLNDNGMRASR